MKKNDNNESSCSESADGPVHGPPSTLVPPLNPSAPPYQAVSDIHTSSSCMDLESIVQRDAVAAFENCLDFIFQHSCADIKQALWSIDLPQLQTIRSQLLDKLVTVTADFSDRRPIKRLNKNTVIPDIYWIGYSVVNKTTSKDLDNVFAKTPLATSDSETVTQVTTEDDDEADQHILNSRDIQDLLTIVFNLRDRVEKLEEAKRISDELCSSLQVEIASLRQSASPRETPNSPMARENSNPITLESAPEQTDESESAANNPVIQLSLKASSVRVLQAAPTTTPPKDSTSPTIEIFIGNVSTANSLDDIKQHLAKIGVSSPMECKQLSRPNRPYKSFKVSVSSASADHVLLAENWPTGFIVRKFTDKKQHTNLQSKPSNLQSAPPGQHNSCSSGQSSSHKPFHARGVAQTRPDVGHPPVGPPASQTASQTTSQTEEHSSHMMTNRGTLTGKHAAGHTLDTQERTSMTTGKDGHLSGSAPTGPGGLGSDPVQPRWTDITIASFNCHGFTNSLDYVIELASQCTVLCLSETWIRPGDQNLIDSAISRCGELSSFTYTVLSKSGMEDADPEYRGRPFGGVSLICKHSDCFNYQNIDVPTDRALAVGIFDLSGDLKQVIIGVYMPFFNSSDPKCINSYIATLEALQSLLDKYGATVPIRVLGDFNAQLPTATKLSRNWHRRPPFTSLSALLYQFMDHNCMCAADMASSQPVSWTYSNEVLGHFSWIDHMLVSQHDLQSILACNIVPRADRNVSDHLPIIATVRITLSRSADTAISSFRALPPPRWRDGVTKQKYSNSVTSRLAHASHLDLSCCSSDTDKQNQVDEYLKFLSSALLGAADDAGCVSAKHGVPKKWWCPKLSRLRDRVRFWRHLWCEMGRPRTGHVYDCYKNTKKEYKRTCRRCIANLEFARNDEINCFFSQRKMKAFWNTVHRSQQSKTESSLTTDSLADHYASIMQSPGDELDPEQRRIHDAVKEKEEHLSTPPTRSVWFSEGTLLKALASLRLDSAPGIDSIRVEHLRFAKSPVLVSLLTSFYVAIFRHCIVPHAFKVGVIVPILKKPMLNANECSNYRPITLSSTFAKLAEKLVTLDHSPCSTQFGFRENRGTDQAICTIHDVIKAMNSNGSPVFLCTLDAEKCFDRIWHEGLFYKLDGLLPDHQWLFMRRWYLSLFATVRWKGQLSRQFRVTRGTRQGSLLSPALFNVFIDGLLSELKAMHFGVRFGNLCINSVAYADDITLLSSTATGLQHLIDACHAYSTRWMYTYGIKKSMCMIAGHHRFLSLPTWTLGNAAITSVDQVEVLGVTLTSDGFSRGHVEKRRKKAVRAFYGLSHAGMLNPGLQPSVKAHLWNSVCRPSMLYGCNAVNISPADLKSLESEQGTLVKRCLRLGKRSRHSALLCALGIERIQDTLMKLTAGLMERILQVDSVCRELYLTLYSKSLPSRVPVPGTVLARAHKWGIPALLPASPNIQMRSDGVVDSLKQLLCHEHFLKPFSDEYVLIRLLTRAF